MRTGIAALGVLLLSGAPTHAETGWNSYTNARFGVAVEYPAALEEHDPEPSSTEGSSFATTDSDVTLQVYGQNSEANQPPREIMQMFKRTGVAYSSEQAGADWFTLTAKRQGSIGYIRCNIGPKNIMGCFELTYHSSDNATWAPVVERMGKSLRILPVTVGH